MIGDLTRLKVGNIVVQSLNGVCALCGTEYHYSLANKMLAELIDQVLQMRDGNKKK
jgi:hypothetical protein